jgi:biotin synthase
METRVAVIGIIVENSESVEKLNAVLHEYGEYIIGRMGIPYRQKKNQRHQHRRRRAPGYHQRAVGQNRPPAGSQRQNGLLQRRNETGRSSMKTIIEQLRKEGILPREDFRRLIEHRNEEAAAYLFAQAREVRETVYGKDVYMRGLIEFTNFCKNDCYYCGIRRSNRNADRYRLTKEQILECCDTGYDLGFRTFVLQGGEDPYYTDERMCDIVRSIKDKYPACAVTLSVGEKSFETYKAYREAGVDRYLLRHETANDAHYGKLHPEELSLENRKRCLYDLKALGFQTGCGFMVGSPYQTTDTIIDDLMFIRELDPEMVGIGPFIPHRDTPFCDETAGRWS